MEIRPAHVNDADGIAHVHVEGWRSTYKGIIADDYLASLSIDYHAERWLEILNKQESKNCIFVAENKDDQVIRFASGGPQRDPQVDFDSELYAIYLLKSAQGRGLGTRLIGAEAHHLDANRFKKLLVWVLEDNPSRKFYEALGGKYVRPKTITIGEQELTEVAYGWRDLRDLAKTNVK